MNTADLGALGIVAEARRRGLELTAGDGDRIVWRGPPGALDNELAEALKIRRFDVLAIVAVGCCRCGTADTRLVVAYWGSAYCANCASEIAETYDRGGLWPTALDDLPTGPDADDEAVETASRRLARGSEAEPANAWRCNGCGADVKPTNSAIEYGRATRCGACFERATRKHSENDDRGD